MYGERFGYEWDHISLDDALTRAYALGVMAALGQRLNEEWDRIRESAPNAYQRSLLDAAYQEGLSRGKHHHRATESVEDAWTAAIEPSTVHPGGDRAPAGAGPSARGHGEALSVPEHKIDVLGLPDVLRYR